MRQLTIRQFHTGMWEEIKDLPIEVTRYNIPIFKVQSVTVGELKELPEKNSKKISEAEIIGAVDELENIPYYGFKLCKTKFCSNPAEKGSDFCKEHK